MKRRERGGLEGELERECERRRREGIRTSEKV